MLAYLRTLLKDPLFMRVCMCLWGLPLAILGIYAAARWHPAGAMEWAGVSVLAVMGLLGVYLLAVAALGSQKLLKKSMDFMHGGGEPVGFLLAMVVMLTAFFVTALFRVMRRG